jgi:hypothetical protein
MRDLHVDRPARNRVTAEFRACEISFELPRTTTLEYLAALLAYLGARHGGGLVGVSLRAISPAVAAPAR